MEKPINSKTQNTPSSSSMEISQPSTVHSSMLITRHRLTGQNFLEWAQSVKLAIDGKGRLGYLTGEVKQPKVGDEGYTIWRSENSLVMAWLLNSMEASIAKPHMFLKTAKEVWDSVRETYSDRENASQVFELKTKLWQSRKVGRDVTTYYNEMVALWQELDQYNEDTWESAADCAKQKKREENDRVYVFLAGVNRDLDEVKGRILGRRPLPSIREVFSEVRIEENRRKIMRGSGEAADRTTETSALFTRENEEKKKPWCDHCKKYWHTKETCWKIHGKPAGYKTKKERALQANMADSSQEQSVQPEQPPFTKAQIDQLLKLLQLSQKASNSDIPSCSFAGSLSTFLCSKENNIWVIDSGATDHMTGNSRLFLSYKPCAGNKKVKVANGTLTPIAGIGSVKISNISLSKVLHVPSLACNLVSVKKITKELNCRAIFLPDSCVFQELTMGRMIGSAEEHDGLYYLEDGSDVNKIGQKTSCFQIFSFPMNNKEVYLMHFRLGHPSFSYLKRLYPTLFLNKDPSSFHCDICALAKHHKNHYPTRLYTPTSPFSLIHSDIWGPSRVSTLKEKRWFMTIIDDHTRISWVYLLKEKNEVETIFKTFFNMVQTQYSAQIKMIRSDNGREYFSKTLQFFFDEKCVIHQSSCTDTPAQNGIAERKNRHLLEVTRSIMFSAKIPKYLWGDALLHATYLINRMPSKILDFKTPIDVFSKYFPNSRTINSLPLKFFGCTVNFYKKIQTGPQVNLIQKGKNVFS